MKTFVSITNPSAQGSVYKIIPGDWLPLHQGQANALRTRIKESVPDLTDCRINHGRGHVYVTIAPSTEHPKVLEILHKVLAVLAERGHHNPNTGLNSRVTGLA